MCDSPTVVQAHDVRPPSGASAPTAAQRISGTGGTAVGQTIALAVGEMATLRVAKVAVRVGWGPTKAAAETAATATSLYLAAGERYDWMVSDFDKYVALRADDGASAFEGHVWTSSGPRAAS